MEHLLETASDSKSVRSDAFKSLAMIIWKKVWADIEQLCTTN